jgi:tungstate transport system permease protein
MSWLNAEVFQIAALSLRVAILATLAACALGIPAGLALGSTAFRGRRALLVALNTALALPTVVVALVIYLLLSRRGPLGDLGLLFTWQAIAIAETVLAFPIAASLSAAAVQAVDPRVLRTAMTLGAGPLRAAWTVAREMRLALAATVAVAFGRVMSEVGAALIVGGNIRHETRTLTTAITLATAQGDFALAIALGLILLALALTVNVCLQLLRGRGDA